MQIKTRRLNDIGVACLRNPARPTPWVRGTHDIRARKGQNRGTLLGGGGLTYAAPQGGLLACNRKSMAASSSRWEVGGRARADGSAATLWQGRAGLALPQPQAQGRAGLSLPPPALAAVGSCDQRIRVPPWSLVWLNVFTAKFHRACRVMFTDFR